MTQQIDSTGPNEEENHVVVTKENPAEKLRLADLPEDILNCIGEHLSPVTACRAVATCKRLHDIWQALPSSVLVINDVFKLSKSNNSPKISASEYGESRCASYGELSSLAWLEQWRPKRLFLHLKGMQPDTSLLNHLIALLYEWTPYLRLLSIDYRDSPSQRHHAIIPICSLMTIVAYTQLRNDRMKLDITLNFSDLVVATHIALELLTNVNVLDVHNVDLRKVDKLIEVNELKYSSNTGQDSFLIAAKKCSVIGLTSGGTYPFQESVCEEFHLADIGGIRMSTTAKVVKISGCLDVEVAAPHAELVHVSTCSEVNWTSFSPSRTIVYFRHSSTTSTNVDIKRVTLVGAASVAITDQSLLKAPDRIDTDQELPLLKEFKLCVMVEIVEVYKLLRKILNKAPNLDNVEVQVDDHASAVDLCELTGLFGSPDSLRSTHCTTCEREKFKLQLDFGEFRRRRSKGERIA